MSDEQKLSNLKKQLEKVNSDINQRKGELKSVLSQLEKFGVGNLDEARKKYDIITGEIEARQERRAELLEKAEERLGNYV